MKNDDVTSSLRVDGKLKLSKVDANSASGLSDKEQSIIELNELRAKIGDEQEKLYAESKQSLLLVFQAMDTGGKDGAVKSVLTGINPAGVVVNSFKAPTPEDLAHDFLWRLHRVTPARGIIGVWNRSHYEDVLITRVHKMIDKATWQRRYEDIVAFEKLLSHEGTTIRKFFLYIDRDEQKERLQARLDDPAKHWKFSEGDLKERVLWNDYMAAYEDAINATSTPRAPWLVIPSNKKWARNVLIGRAVLEALREMNPQFPDVKFDPKKIVIK